MSNFYQHIDNENRTNIVKTVKDILGDFE